MPQTLPKGFGFSFLVISGALLLSLLSHTPTDPSWNLAVESETQNLLGEFGAILSDLVLQLFGLLSYVIAFFSFLAGFFILMRPKTSSLLFRSFLFIVGFLLLLVSFSFWKKGGALGHLLFQNLSKIPFSPLSLTLIFLAIGFPLLLQPVPFERGVEPLIQFPYLLPALSLPFHLQPPQ